MSNLCAVVYMSRAVRDITHDRLLKILEDARQFNEQANVTGVLFFHHDVFFQYIEGPCDTELGLYQAYDKIKNSKQHIHIDELFNAPIEQRIFPRWSMGASYVDEAQLISLRTADWRNQVFNVIKDNQEQITTNDGFAYLSTIITESLDMLDSNQFVIW